MKKKGREMGRKWNKKKQGNYLCCFEFAGFVQANGTLFGSIWGGKGRYISCDSVECECVGVERDVKMSEGKGARLHLSITFIFPLKIDCDAY